MALVLSYDYNAVYTYSANSDDTELSLDGNSDDSGTVESYGSYGKGSSDSNGTITTGYTVNLSNGASGTIYGYYTGASGTVYMVMQSSDGDTYYLLSPTTVAVTGADLPATIDMDDVTTDAVPVCFTAGTLIAVPGGETAVEDLQIGDMILTAEGKTVPVKWIGRRKMMKLFTPADRLRPVRVSAGALGDGLPHTDLLLTADHAFIMDGLAINASALVNGTTIFYEPMDNLPDQFTYFHVETEDHNVILANGAPAETYIDYVARSAFDNHREYLELYGAEKVISEMPLPRISAARMLPDAIRAKLQGAKAA